MSRFSSCSMRTGEFFLGFTVVVPPLTILLLLSIDVDVR
jgi:Flp pilus assembly protein TadG